MDEGAEDQRDGETQPESSCTDSNDDRAVCDFVVTLQRAALVIISLFYFAQECDSHTEEDVSDRTYEQRCLMQKPAVEPP